MPCIIINILIFKKKKKKSSDILYLPEEKNADSGKQLSPSFLFFNSFILE